MSADPTGLQQDRPADEGIIEFDDAGRAIIYKQSYLQGFREVDKKVLTPMKTGGILLLAINPLDDIATLCKSPGGMPKAIAFLRVMLTAVPADDAVKVLSTLAAKVIGPGKGAVHGTRIHTVLKQLILQLGRFGIHVEVSYLNGKVVPAGTPGSVRLDVVVGSREKPEAIYDLKTGGAGLTSTRILQIRQHLPQECDNIPIHMIKR